jgi:hypothetical protein
MGLYQDFKQLPPWAKGAIGVGAAVVIYAVGKSVWNAVQQVKQNAQNLKTAGDAVQTLTQLAAQQGEIPTQTDAQFASWSNALGTAMSGCTTDHSTLENIFSSLNNDADVYKLIAVFGSQTMSGCEVLWINWTSGGTYSLPAAISTYVSATEKTALNAILASKGISYVFA